MVGGQQALTSQTKAIHAAVCLPGHMTEAEWQMSPGATQTARPPPRFQRVFESIQGQNRRHITERRSSSYKDTLAPPSSSSPGFIFLLLQHFCQTGGRTDRTLAQVSVRRLTHETRRCQNITLTSFMMTSVCQPNTQAHTHSKTKKTEKKKCQQKHDGVKLPARSAHLAGSTSCLCVSDQLLIT